MLSSICFMPASLTPQSLPPLVTHHVHDTSPTARRNVHARRVVPDEEWFVGLLGIVAIQPINDVGRDFLVHGFRTLQRQRAFVLARLFLAVPSGDFIQDHRARRRQASAVFGINRARGFAGCQESASFMQGGRCPARWASC